MFFLLPVGVEYRTQRFPIVTITIIGLNVLTFIFTFGYYLHSGEQAEEWMHHHLWLIPEESIWYTYITALFVHGGFLHIIGNMVFLFLFGACLEDHIGRWQFAIFYLV